MKKHHAMWLLLTGIIVIILATSFTSNSQEPEQIGYTVSEQIPTDAVACCVIGEKTCYTFDGSCAACDVLCG